MRSAPTVARIMTRLVMTTSPEARLDQAARLLREWHVSSLPVVDARGRVVGVVGEKDVVRVVHSATGVALPRGLLDLLLESSPAKGESLLSVCRSRLRNTRVRKVMNPAVATVRPETSLIQAARLMKVNGTDGLPVVDGEDHLVGIITKSDIAQDLSLASIRGRGSLHPGPKQARAGADATDLFADI